MENKKYIEKIAQLEKKHQYELSKISHEIRNPVTLINSFLQLLAYDHPEITHFEYWDNITDNMQYLILLLQEISNYNNSKMLHPKEVDFYRFVKSIIGDLNTNLIPRHISIRLEKKSALPPLSIDTLKMKEAILNLLRNSCEAISQDGEILVSLSCDGSYMLLQICDRGSGIPEEYMDTLFTPFVTHKEGGTGLGLAIVKNILTAHGGTVAVQSSATTGTIFSLKLPV